MTVTFSQLSIQKTPFGTCPQGRPVDLFCLRNANGLMVKITNFGGVVTEIHTPDKNGNFADITLGFDHLEPYIKDSPCFGALIGRYASRIAKGQFTLDGVQYQLELNDGENHLHGGMQGFDKVLWNAEPFETHSSVGVSLTYISHDGDQGYPGNLSVTAIYELTNNNQLVVKFHATTDKATPVNLTQHSYFNLAGKGDVLGHEIMINADAITSTNAQGIPTGDIASVQNTCFDLREPTQLANAFEKNTEQLAQGFNHNFVLNKTSEHELSFAARVHEPNSGRVLEVFTQEPGLQFYTAYYLDGSLTGKGWHYTRASGLCLEPQHFPDSPNQPHFPNTILKPNEVFSSAMAYKFSVQS